MAEYIAREVLLAQLRAMESYNVSPMYRRGYDDCVTTVLKAPAADVVPVVHGKWIEKPEETYCPVQYGEDAEPILHKYTRYICNLCGRSSAIPEPYCHCGAKMDGDAE